MVDPASANALHMKCKKNPIKQGAINLAFLIDTVRRISRHLDFALTAKLNNQLKDE